MYMNEEIIPADKKLRTKILIGIILTMPIGAFYVYNFTSYIKEISTAVDVNKAIDKVKDLVFWATLVNAVISSIFSAYLLFLANRVYKFQRFPPMGMRVIRDTKVASGKNAYRIGALLILVALLILSTNLFMWYMKVIIDNLFAQAA